MEFWRGLIYGLCIGSIGSAIVLFFFAGVDKCEECQADIVRDMEKRLQKGGK